MLAPVLQRCEEAGAEHAGEDTSLITESRDVAQEHLRRRIREIYAGIPEKTPEEVDAILVRFSGRERELLDKMASKYQLPRTQPPELDRD